MEITQEPLIRSRWNFLRLLPWMFTLQWRRRHSLMWHLWRQPWRHRRHGKCRMTQTSTRQGYGTVCVFCWVISFQYTFSRSGNSMVRLSVLYHHRLTSKIQFEPEILELRGYPSFSLMEFYDITYIYVFEVEEFNGDTFRILRLPVDLENPGLTGNTGTSRLPIFFPGGILWYHLYLCFRGRGIQWWHVQNSTTTGWPRKSRFNRKYWNFKVTHLFPWWNFMISPIFMFSRSRNSMVTRSEFYDYRLTSKIQV